MYISLGAIIFVCFGLLIMYAVVEILENHEANYQCDLSFIGREDECIEKPKSKQEIEREEIDEYERERKKYLEEAAIIRKMTRNTI